MSSTRSALFESRCLIGLNEQADHPHTYLCMNKICGMIRIQNLLYGMILLASIKPSDLQAQVAGSKSSMNQHLLGKGNAYLGATFNVGKNDVTDKDGLIVFVNEQKKNNFSFSIDGGYFIKKNLAVGGLIEYGNNQVSALLTDPSTGATTQLKEEKTNLGIYGVFKGFIPIDDKQRFAIFNQVLLGGQNKSKLTESITNGELKRVYVENNSLELRFSPGIQVQVIRGFCVEAGTEVAAFRKSWNQTTENGNATTKGSSFTADLTINLLRFRLGFYYYFPTKFSKP